VSPYQRIVEDIRRRIAAGELRAGDRVPSARQLTRDWGVALATATKALGVLQSEGLTQARRGVGTVVSDAAGRPVAGLRPRRTGDSLTRQRVVAAAIELADADGMGEASMRRVAAALGVATMSLYRYVPSKDALVLAMIDAVFAEHPLPAVPPRGWRPRLELCARRQWAMFRRHPWLAGSISLTRPQLAPHAMAHTEWVLAALEETGLDLNDRMYLHIVLLSQVRGLATAFEPEADAQRDTGMTNDEWMQAHQPTVDALLRSGSLPNLARMVERDDFDLDLDRLFRVGLDRLLDGVAVLVAHRRR
jgi:AcrR family transcriptional regulator